MSHATVVARSLLSALGADAPTSCASARAGLVRARPLEGVFAASSVDGELAPVVGHVVPLVTHGFEGGARLERLLATALTDLGRQLPQAAARPAASGLYLSLPPPWRTTTGLDLVASESERETYGEEAEGVAHAAQREDVDAARALAMRAAAQAGLAEACVLRGLSFDGHSGGVRCLSQAIDDLALGRIDLAIVAGVDCLLDRPTIAWLNATSRLKHVDMPVGLQPGEACAVLALRRAPAAGEAHGRIVQAAVGEEERSLLSGGIPVGVGLARVLAEVAAAAHWRDDDTAWLVCDHNGEPWRAMEWGHACVRLRPAHRALGDPIVWTPAESFGDTGAASALVGACVGLAAFERGYAPAARAVVASASEGRMRGALVLEAR